VSFNLICLLFTAFFVNYTFHRRTYALYKSISSLKIIDNDVERNYRYRYGKYVLLITHTYRYMYI